MSVIPRIKSCTLHFEQLGYDVRPQSAHLTWTLLRDQDTAPGGLRG